MIQNNTCNEIAKNYSIIIMSCDPYSDVWDSMTETFDRFWPHCPFEVYLCSENKKFEHTWIKNIRTEKRMGWGEMLDFVLKKVNTPYVIYMQEDYLLKSTINNDQVFTWLTFFESTRAAYLRMLPWPNPDLLFENRTDVGLISEKDPFRTSLQCAVWDKCVLQKLVKVDESGWDFEANSGARTQGMNRPFLSLKAEVDYATMNDLTYPIDYFATGVLHGKWMREAIFYFRKIGVNIDPGKRGVITRWDYWYRHQCKNEAFKEKFFLKMLNRVFNSVVGKSIHNSYIIFRAKLKSS